MIDVRCKGPSTCVKFDRSQMKYGCGGRSAEESTGQMTVRLAQSVVCQSPIAIRGALALCVVISGIACAGPTGPDAVGGGGGSGLRLTVTERSATTVSVRWEAPPSSTGRYTVDNMALSQCGTNIPHGNGLVLGDVLSATIVGLTPSTEYQIHVHRLIGDVGQKTDWNYVLVRTAAPGSGPQPVVQADYTTCGGQ